MKTAELKVKIADVEGFRQLLAVVKDMVETIETGGEIWRGSSEYARLKTALQKLGVQIDV